MTDLRVVKWNRRYRLGGDPSVDRARVDRVLSTAVSESLLDAAIERAGISTTDELCIRSVQSLLRFDGAEPDSRLAVACSVALAEAIARRLSEGGPDVVRFASRRDALVDMTCSVVRGNLGRSWAWRQLDIWHAADFVTPGEARAQVFDALVHEAHAAPAVLAFVAREGLLGSLSVAVHEQRWTALARAALFAFDADSSLVHALEIDYAPGDSDGAFDGTIARIAIHSALLGRGLLDLPLNAATARAWATLAILECEPSLVHSPMTTHIVGGLATLATTHVGEQRRVKNRSAARKGDTRKASVSTLSREDEPAPDGQRTDNRARGVTMFAGVVFLLHLVRALDLPTLILADPAFNSRALRWTLHQLALLLAPVDALDAAALAFCGLAPDAQPPSHDEPPPTDAERSVLATLVDDICASIRERSAADADEADDALLRRITWRRAEVVADPAWLELHFALADATTDVRRIGLDLDLGWLPWLGTVLRFIYE